MSPEVIPVEKKSIRYKNAMEEVSVLIKAGVAIIYVLTHEESRFIQNLYHFFAEPRKKDLYVWSSYRGIIKYEDLAKKDKAGSFTTTKATGEFAGTEQIVKALQIIETIKTPKEKSGMIFVMQDMHLMLSQGLPRQLRDMVPRLSNDKKSIVITAGQLAYGPGLQRNGLEPTLEKDIRVVDYELPTQDEIFDHLKSLIESFEKASKKKVPKFTDIQIREFASACQGLTQQEMLDAVYSSMSHLQTIDTDKLLLEKKQIIKKSDILEYIDIRPSFDEVGGLDEAKKYFSFYADQFDPEAKKFGMEPLRGVLLLGVPGCLRKDTLIHDPVDGTIKTVELRWQEAKPFHIMALNKDQEVVIAQADPPQKYPEAEMIEFTTSNGKKFAVTPAHRFHGEKDWVYASEVYEWLQEYGPYPLLSIEGSDQLVPNVDGLHYSQIIQDSPIDYQHDPCSCDELLHQEIDNDPDVLPLQGDVHEHSLSYPQRYSQHKGGQAWQREYSHPYQFGAHHSKLSCVFPSEEAQLSQISLGYQLLDPAKYVTHQQSHSVTSHQDTFASHAYPVQASIPNDLSSVFVSQQQHNFLGSQHECDEGRQVHQVSLIQYLASHPVQDRFASKSCQPDKARRPLLSSHGSSSSSLTSSTKYTRKKVSLSIKIVSAKQVSPEPYYDFHVPEYENYFAYGIFHHNTGKSLLAKAVASLWKLPLLRLDVGKVMAGIVGQSEGRMRDALSQAQSCAPTVLWIDEIEKALSGTKSSNMSDSGTLSRVFGTLLTWMEETSRDVVILATANDISQIPPELIRRFNEVFFVDLPEPVERAEIFNIHFSKRGRNVEKLKINIKELVSASHLYTGSEIEKSVREGIARSWRDGKRELRTNDILDALHDTKPISTVMAEKINELRQWARERARYASSIAAASHGSGAQKITTSSGREMSVDEALGDLDEVENPKDRKVIDTSSRADAALE